MANFFKNLVDKIRAKRLAPGERLKKNEDRLARMARAKNRLKKLELEIKKVELEKIAAHSRAIRWALAVIAIYLLSELVGRILGISIQSDYSKTPTRYSPPIEAPETQQNYSSIEQRNMFNVEGTIPEPFDQGLLDCLSQAKRSNINMELLGTIVMKDDRYSVALIEEGSNKTAIRTNDEFGNGKYIARKVERKKFCFEVKSTQALEYIDIKEKDGISPSGPSLALNNKGTGIKALSENNFEISRSTLEDKLNDLTAILQSARAVPHVDASGKFVGFLVQWVNEDSVFYELGVRRGDILNQVNEITLDNPGKGLEAFQALRGSNQISLEVTRDGQKKVITYDING